MVTVVTVVRPEIRESRRFATRRELRVVTSTDAGSAETVYRMTSIEATARLNLKVVTWRRERAYVTLRDDNAVVVLDTRSRLVFATIPVGRGPVHLIAGPDGRQVYVANQGAETGRIAGVSVIDARRSAVRSTSASCKVL